MNKQRSELKDKWYRLDKAALKEHVGDASRLVDGHESMIDIRRGVTPHGAASVPLMERVRAASTGGGGSESSGGGTEERGIGGRKSELAISRRIERLEIGVAHVGDGAVRQRGHGGLDGLRARDHADVHGGRRRGYRARGRSASVREPARIRCGPREPFRGRCCGSGARRCGGSRWKRRWKRGRREEGRAGGGLPRGWRGRRRKSCCCTRCHRTQ